MAVEYQAADNYRAVLISSLPVIREDFYYQSPLTKWVLLRERLAEDIKKHGLFVITDSLDTKKCGFTAWRKPKTEVIFSFDVGISSLAGLSL